MRIHAVLAKIQQPSTSLLVSHMRQPFINILPFVSKVNTHRLCVRKHLVNNPVGNGLVGQVQ
jgi:hypothetical protein